MKRILIVGALALVAAGQAFAADLPPPAPPPRAPATYVPAPVPIFTWTGFYLGVNGGYGFGRSEWTAAGGGTTGNFDANGFLAGGTLGGNYQFGAFVIGLEGDGDWSNLNGSFTNPAGAGSPCGFACKTSSDWLATVRGRAGYAVDRVLFYGTGGAAFANVEAQLPFFRVSQNTTEVGWTAGGGVEFAFTPNLTGKLEYLYVDLGNMSCTIGCSAPGAIKNVSVALSENVVRAGINYKFGW